MPTLFLFHGPSSKNEALLYIKQNGFLSEQKFSLENLKKDSAKEIVSFLRWPSIAQKTEYLLLGPAETFPKKSLDVFLKSLEELPCRSKSPVFWGNQVSEIPQTILSRLELRWCPSSEVTHREDVFSKALELYLKGESFTLQKILQESKEPYEALDRLITSSLKKENIPENMLSDLSDLSRLEDLLLDDILSCLFYRKRSL